MEFVKAMRIVKRMCKQQCADCPLSFTVNGDGLGCTDRMYEKPKEFEKKLEQWEREHPQKTMLQDFKEKYPNAIFAKDGTPTHCCPYHLGYKREDCKDVFADCVACWNKPLESEVE